MASLQNSPSIHRTLFLNSFPQLGLQKHGQNHCCRRGVSFLVKAEQLPPPAAAAAAASTPIPQDKPGRRHVLAVGAIASWVSVISHASTSFAAENKKGFQIVKDNNDGYSFLYPFGWQEVSIEGQDKVFKDVIEPLESVSVNLIPTNKEDIRDLGSPQEVAETLIRKVLAPPSQKTKLIEAKEHEIDGKAYYTIEFIAKAPNYTRHALSTISIGNGKCYTLTTGANERRWGKMKDKLNTVVDSFQIVKT